MLNRYMKITAEQAEAYLQAEKLIRLGGSKIVLPFIVVCKGYGEDYENYSELNLDDYDNDNVANGGYEDYQLWHNDGYQAEKVSNL